PAAEWPEPGPGRGPWRYRRVSVQPNRGISPAEGAQDRDPSGRGACRQEALVSSRNGAASSEARLRLLESVVASANDSVVITKGEPLDEPGPVIEWVNPAFARMTGYTAEEAIGKNPRLLQ